MAARFADGGCGRNEQSLALVAVTAHTLLRRLVGQLLAIPGGHGEHALLLGQRLCSSNLLGLDLCLLRWGLPLGVARTLLAALVLALGTHLVGTIGGPAAVTCAVDTHANGLLDTLDIDGESRCGNPLVRLEGQAVLGEESAGALLLHDGALEGGDDGLCGLVLVVVVCGGSDMVGCNGIKLSRGTVWWLAIVTRAMACGSQCRTYAVAASFSSSMAAGAAVVGEAGAVAVEGLVLDDFSRLKTLLMRFTYLPRLLRGLPSFASLMSGGGVEAWADMACCCERGSRSGGRGGGCRW